VFVWGDERLVIVRWPIVRVKYEVTCVKSYEAEVGITLILPMIVPNRETVRLKALEQLLDISQSQHLTQISPQTKSMARYCVYAVKLRFVKARKLYALPGATSR
jgi:hypothetical protein